MTLKSGLGVIQSHGNNNSIDRMSFYWCSMVNVALFSIVSEIKRDIGKMSFFMPHLHLTPSSVYCDKVWRGKTRMMYYPTVDKVCRYFFSLFDAIPACDGQRDGHFATA